MMVSYLTLVRELANLRFMDLTGRNLSRLHFWPLLLDQELLQPVPMHLWQHCLRVMA